MTTHRRPLKIRRTGRHTAPSRTDKVAETAVRAAPAVAIAGTLVASPHAQAAVKIPAKPAAPAERVHTAAKVSVAKVTRAAQADRTYTVRQGDTLTAIAQRIWHSHYASWIQLYQANRAQISDPNLIYPGEVLKVPDGPAAHLTASYTPPAASSTRGENENDGGGSDNGGQPAGENENDGGGSEYGTQASSDSENDGGQPASQAATQSAGSTALSGTLSCSGLEQLWEQAGGTPSQAVTAASVAMAESSGDQYSTGPVGERGYWQIAPFNAGSSYDPMTNAKAAVAISSNGTDWTPWTTYNSGAYTGKC